VVVKIDAPSAALSTGNPLCGKVSRGFPIGLYLTCTNGPHSWHETRPLLKLSIALRRIIHVAKVAIARQAVASCRVLRVLGCDSAIRTHCRQSSG
jgi:hypothetical protein